MDFLPEDCLSRILSFTSPLDARSSSLVSSSFQVAAESDTVWEKFLPVDTSEIISRSVRNLNYHSKKQLFQILSHPTLIDHGHKSFKLEKSSGKKCYVLSARELSIAWSNEPLYWCWKPFTQSRFSEVAELRTTDWLEIKGNIDTKMLSPNTRYAAYLIIKISDRSYGLDLTPSEVSVQVGCNQVCTNTFHLREPNGDEEEREDGWLEVELGEFFINGGNYDDEQVKVSLMEVKGYHLKGGLIVDGIEFRPK